jgi:hypothetical protein
LADHVGVARRARIRLDDADLEMIRERFGGFEAPDLPPVISCEATARGWRGLTADGEVLNVEGARIPDDTLCIMRNGRPVGYRTLPKQRNGAGTIDLYLNHFNQALDLCRANNPAAALDEINSAIAIADTTRAKFNRAMVLLGLGRWVEGFAEYADCERDPLFMRPAYRQAIEVGLRPWQGEDIAGKRLLLIHAHGFGDSIMTLRYVSQLKGMGADVVLLMPPELRRLAAQCAPVVSEIVPADYFCPMLMLLHVLRQTPEQIPLAPYLAVDKAMSDKWLSRVDPKSIGIAWSVGKYYDGDYPRAAPLAKFIEHLDGAKLISMQQQREDASALGVKTFEFDDFADCAGLMMLLDEIVTVDTAALHLAGAIGHPRVTALLSHWASWRWLSPLYDGVTFCRQQKPGDWASAFAQRERKS